MDQRYRALFVNSLSGFKSANLVGTKDQAGLTNLTIVSSVFHVGANPPLMGLLMRPHNVPRDTLENIKQTKVFTLNHVNKQIAAAAHQTSARYDHSVSEFDATGLTPWYSETFSAPYVKESRLKIGLSLDTVHLIEANQTELIIGRIEEVIVDEAVVTQDGYIDIEQLGSVAITSLDGYHSTQRIARYSYAQPDRKPEPKG